VKYAGRIINRVGDRSTHPANAELSHGYGLAGLAEGPVDYFTGSVQIDSRLQRKPGSAGGRCACYLEGGNREEICPGDIVWFPPGEKHWHGATAITAMSHIAIAETRDGRSVDWMEKVTDEQYEGR
jgi:4-carboxymuconolactone decarboxylase